MKIDFHTDNPDKAATVQTFLFTDYFAQIMIGQKIEHCGDTYQVNYMENDDKTGKLKNVFVWKYPTADNNIKSDATGCNVINNGTDRNVINNDARSNE